MRLIIESVMERMDQASKLGTKQPREERGSDEYAIPPMPKRWCGNKGTFQCYAIIGRILCYRSGYRKYFP